MKAYLLASGRTLYPFDDAPAQWRILDRPLIDQQAEVWAARGFELTPIADRAALPASGSYVVLSDALYASAEAVDLFLASARRLGHSAQAAAAPGPYATNVLWHLPRDTDERVPLPLWYHAGDEREPVPLELVLDQELFYMPMPAHMGTAPGKGLETYLTPLVMVEIETWINLYQANMQALLARISHAKQLPWWRGLWALVRGGGNQYGAMAKLSKIGKNCDIHPTAVIELSEIGDNVRIGAHAVVRLSVVGNGAMIDDHASVRAVVVGEGAAIANNNNVLMCVVYPRAFLISGPYQFSMFGHDTAIMHCICCDTRLDGFTIRAEVGPGRVVDSHQRYLGSCYGHGVRAGAGTITAPGRAIPNHIHFLPNPQLVVGGVDPALPRRKNLFTEGGGLTFKGRPPEASLSVPQAQETPEPSPSP